ncbi:MAG: fibronectin type III domain-containing protein [Ginsengibacter sp.]
MLKILFSLTALFILSGSDAQVGLLAKKPVVIIGKLVRTTKPLRDYKLSDKAIPDVKVRDEDGIIGKDEAFEEGEERTLYPSSRIFSEDPALQKIYPNNPHLQSQASRSINTNFSGMPYQPLNPPDPTLCAGPNHVIQMINGTSGALFKVFNKTGGQVVAQTYLDAITGKGGLGDPIALYDQLADRFILTEFANKPETGTEGLIFAVSQTPDPAGGWYVYFFSTGTTFPDYPKFSVWTDAYYGTTNNFANGSSYSGSSVYAFDKAKMLIGNASTTMQKFTLGTTNKFFSMIPVGLEGSSLPPAGTGGLIAYMQDDTWTSSTLDADSIGILEFKVDFVTPANSTVSTKVSLATTAYKSDVCGATRGQCISQAGSLTKVEALHQKIMNQPLYRKFGSYEGIVMSHVVDKGANISGVRWYELRKTTGNWSIYQQSTYAPDNTNRWLPGICYDKNGNIALAYNVSSSGTGVYPGARYTGRKECDALNTMTYSEDVIVNGTAASTSTRYGDYNHLVSDPDGVTFWFTCEYNVAGTWSTRIASFTLDPCASVCGDPSALASSSISNTSATVSWAGASGAVSYDVDYKLTTSQTWTNAVTATTLLSFNIAGLTQGTIYDWRVRTNCISSATSNYVASQFTTTAPVLCGVPSGLASSSVSTSSENVSWTSVSGANSYDVDYEIPGSNNWTPAATAITTTTTTISGLTAGTLYDWRVRATCSGNSGNYATAQFTTSSPVVCDAPGGLTSSSITSNGATLTWNAANGANNYNVEYSIAGAGNWITAAAANTTRSVIVGGLTSATSYDWRVISNCTGTNTASLIAQFTTTGVVTCNDQLEPNNTSATAKAISLNTDYDAILAAPSDIDYYSFSNSGSQKNVQVTLSNIPLDFDVRLLDANGSLLAGSVNNGTTKTIGWNTKKVSSFKVNVYSPGNSTSPSCYRLRVTASAATFSPSVPDNFITQAYKGGLKVFPVPASASISVSFNAFSGGVSDVTITNQLGQQLLNKKLNVVPGNNMTNMNISNLISGVYFVKVFNGKIVETQKMIVNK